MSDSKSKLPDMNELGKMANKILNDVKKSLNEAITEFKKGRAVSTEEPKVEVKDAPQEKTAEKEEYKQKDE